MRTGKRRHKTAASPPLDLGPLPVSDINRILGLQLDAGAVHFSVRAQDHARRRHPNDFDLCRRHVGRIVARPDYIGRGPNQLDGFELIGDIAQDNVISLVAIKLQRDHSGRYIVANTYLIDRNTLDRRLRKGFAKPV